MRRTLGIAQVAVGAILTLIGIGGLPEDIETWRGWLAPVGRFLADNPARWVFLAVGLILLGSKVWDSARSRRGRPAPDLDLEFQQLPPKTLPSMARHWLLRYRIHNHGLSDEFGARANFIVNGDVTGSSPWFAGWGTSGETHVQILTDHYEDLNVAVVVAPANTKERWRVHGVRPPYESIGYRDDPVTNSIGFSFLIATRDGKRSRHLGVRVVIQDGTPRAVELVSAQ